MELIEKLLIIPVAMLISIYLIYILLTQNTTNFEKMFTIIVLMSHVLLFTSYYTNDNELKDHMHLIYLLSVSFGSLLFTNKSLILLLIFILIVNILFWVIYGNCPMGDLKTDDLLLYNKLIKPYINLGVIILLTVLIIKYIKQ